MLACLEKQFASISAGLCVAMSSVFDSDVGRDYLGLGKMIILGGDNH